MKTSNYIKIMKLLDAPRKIIDAFLPVKIKKALSFLYFPNYFASSLKKKKMEDFYSAFISPGDLVFDIGANIGRYTEIFLDLGAKVIAVEPNPEAAEKIKEKSRGKNLVVINKGIDEKEGVKDFYINLENRDYSTFSQEWKNKGVNAFGKLHKKKYWKKETIGLTSIDKLIKEFGLPKFIKIDVEGYEEKALRGMSKKPKFLSFEFNKPYKNLKDVEACIKVIEKLSLEAIFSFSWHDLFELASWRNSKGMLEEIRQANFELTGGDIYVRMD